MRKFGFSIYALNSDDKIVSYKAQEFFVDKFKQDKIFVDNTKYSIVLDGVILNKNYLSGKSGLKEWEEVIIDLYLKHGEIFFNELRGTFAGVLYDKINHKIIAFSDQIGSRFLYYTVVGEKFFLSTMMDDVYNFRNENNARNILCTENAYLLLSYGFMIDDRTLCEDIKKIKPGCYLVIQNGRIEEKQYFLLDNTPDNSLTEADWVERIDEEFRKAVAQQFDKDNVYGYKHLVALSAGLDSRMTCWVAHELGYTDQLNFTFSQSDYYDETVPKKIASDLKHEWIFKALDNGLWLYNLDDITRLTGGNVLYYGLSHAYSMFSELNFEDLGMIHTGQLGDVILGTWYESKDDKARFIWGDGAYSRTMLERIIDLKHSDYKNQEIAKFYLRGFSGTNNGNMAEYAFTESFSPFYNLEFLQTALSIPVEYRFGHDIYKKWIIEKYPKAAEYIWEKIKCRITRKHGMITYHGRSKKMEDVPKILLRRIAPKLTKLDSHDMNPLGYYIKTNERLNRFLQSYDQYIDCIANEQLRNDVISLCNSNNGIERIQAVSLLSAIKTYYCT